MRRSLIALAAAALLLASFPVRSPALDSSSLWPKLLQILEKLQEMEAQNKEILQNQQRILQEIKSLSEALQQVEGPPGGRTQSP